MASLILGAETTSPSRTIATSFCGAGSFVTDVVSAPNFEVPTPLKLSKTYQPEAPC